MKYATLFAGMFACGVAVAVSASAATLPNIRSAVPCFFGALGSPATCRPTQTGALGLGTTLPEARPSVPRSPAAETISAGSAQAVTIAEVVATEVPTTIPVAAEPADPVSSVPIPGSWLALASGLVLLVGSRRRGAR